METPRYVWFAIAVPLAAGVAGWFIPELYDSTELNQSSDVEQAIVWRALAASGLVMVAVVLGWYVWRSFMRPRPNVVDSQQTGQQAGQLNLRSLFAAITAVAVAIGAWKLAQEESEFWFVGFFVTVGLLTLVVGRSTYLAVPNRAVENRDENVQQKRSWWLFVAGILGTIVLLTVCWLGEIRFGYAGIAWIIIFVLKLIWSPHHVRVGGFCFLAAVMFPFVWLFRELDRFEDLLNMFSFFVVSPGIVPGAMIRWTPDSLVPATVCMLVLSLLGLGAAYWGRLSIAIFSGLASAVCLNASFMLHAMFRA